MCIRDRLHSGEDYYISYGYLLWEEGDDVSICDITIFEVDGGSSTCVLLTEIEGVEDFYANEDFLYIVYGYEENRKLYAYSHDGTLQWTSMYEGYAFTPEGQVYAITYDEEQFVFGDIDNKVLIVSDVESRLFDLYSTLILGAWMFLVTPYVGGRKHV
jgi:hypothetical protein